MTPVYDLTVKDADLVVATHGRFLDHGRPDAAAPTGRGCPRRRRPALRYAAGGAYRTRSLLRRGPPTRAGLRHRLTTAATFVAKEDGQRPHPPRVPGSPGEAAPHGADYLRSREAPDADTPVAPTIVTPTARGAQLHAQAAGYDEWDDKRKAMEPGPWIALERVHRFLWDLRGEGSARAGDKTVGAACDALVLPGAYTVELTVATQRCPPTSP